MVQGIAAEVGQIVAPQLVGDVGQPSKGYFHILHDPHNPAWVSIVRTAVPMGVAAFTRRFPGMVREQHYVVVGSVHTALAPGVLCGLAATDLGIEEAHADALRQAKQACLKENFVRAVMYDAELGGWWVHLSGPRRFKDWRALGLFSATTALFTDWSQLAAMQYDPAETDVSDLVKIDLEAMLKAAGVVCKRVKRPVKWTDNSTAKPYFALAGKDREPGPVDDRHLPVSKVHHTDHDTYDMPYLGEPGQVVSEVAAEDDMSPRVRELLQRSQVVATQASQAQPAQTIYQGADPDYVHPLLADRKPEGFWP